MGQPLKYFKAALRQLRLGIEEVSAVNPDELSPADRAVRSEEIETLRKHEKNILSLIAAEERRRIYDRSEN